MNPVLICRVCKFVNPVLICRVCKFVNPVLMCRVCKFVNPVLICRVCKFANPIIQMYTSQCIVTTIIMHVHLGPYWMLSDHLKKILNLHTYVYHTITGHSTNMSLVYSTSFYKAFKICTFYTDYDPKSGSLNKYTCMSMGQTVFCHQM